jgi:beta-lactamase regulating signal transducer with metallopeptidase domain
MIHVTVESNLPTWLAWAVTYLVHALVWLGLGWICSRPALRLTARTQNAIWRAALLAPLVSASLHAGGISPARLATWHVAATSVTAPSAPLAPPAPTFARPAVWDGDLAVAGDPIWPDAIAAFVADPPRARPARMLAASGHGRQPVPGSAALLLIFAIVIVCGVAGVRLVRVALAAAQLERRLNGRRPIDDARVLQLLRRLVRRARLSGPIVITESDTVICPVAVGSREICLPARVAERLDERALEALLAHELAHLERRDNLWLLIGAVIEAAFWAPPLARIVRGHMQESAELAADDRAVELTADPLGLARSLAEVASWGADDGEAGLAHAMASPRRGLVGRVERLIARHDGPSATSTAGRAMAAALLLLALVTPGIHQASAAPATVANDKPGAPRLPWRPAIVVPTVVVAGGGPAVIAAPRDADVVRRVRLPRMPRMPRLAAMPSLPRGAGGALGELVQRAMEESGLAMNLATARRDVEQLRRQGASASERQAAEARVAELERLHARAQSERARHEDAFGREMEAWGKELSWRGAELGNEMEAWAMSLADTQLRERDQRVRQQDESGRRDDERGRREAEGLRRAEERMKRDAERMRREADRLTEEADRLAKRAAAPGAPPANAEPAIAPRGPAPPAPAIAPAPSAPARIQP